MELPEQEGGESPRGPRNSFVPSCRPTQRDAGSYFEEEAGEFLPFDFDDPWCALSHLPETNLRILRNAVESGLAARPDVSFLPLFRFAYADGHEMVTIGGMVGGKAEERALDACDWAGAQYVRREDTTDPYRIQVPRLTRKERLFMDKYMPCPDGWLPSEFELEWEAVEAYREVHPFYPHYGEFIA